MFGSNALEIAIGLVFIYLLLSVLCTVINEGIAAAIEQRGKTLLEGVKNLLNDPEFNSLAQYVYNHGLIGGMMEGVTDFTKTNRLPSYIAPNNFALALIDILGSYGAGPALVEQRQKELVIQQEKSIAEPANESLKETLAEAQAALELAIKGAADLRLKYGAAQDAAKEVKKLADFGKIQKASETLQNALTAGRVLAAEHPDALAAIEKGIEALAPGYTKQSLLTLIDKTKRETRLLLTEIQTGEQAVEKLRQNLEDWFNDAMDRFSGWYKRWTRQISFGVAVVIVVVANADTMMLANRLARDAALRAGIVAAADNASQKIAGDTSNIQTARQQLLDESEKLNLPLGWMNPEVNGTEDPFAPERIPQTTSGWLMKIFGLLMTALAVSLGAPFWFDTLSKFMNVRGAGKVPDTNQTSSGQYR
jgi:hypothetical protein